MDIHEDKLLLKQINIPLIDWYHSQAHVRQMPWRVNRNGYSVWVSEIMLQQTRVEAVKPYYIRFMKELPNIAALARAKEERLMKLWEGLGYYSRVRNMKKAAECMEEQYQGRMPEEYSQLLSLPGIGNYTAGAIASIAFGKPVPAVDGNVLRVISRILASYEDIAKPATKSRVEKLLGETMSQERPGDYNEGLMELGATVCIPAGQPKCQICPLKSLCRANSHNLTEEIPVKTAAKKRKIEKRTVFLLEYENRVAICKRGSQGLLAGMYELPNVEGELERGQLKEVLPITDWEAQQAERLPEAKHIFSHVEWHMKGYGIALSEMRLPDSYILVHKQELQQSYAIPSAFDRYIKLIK